MNFTHFNLLTAKLSLNLTGIIKHHSYQHTDITNTKQIIIKVAHNNLITVTHGCMYQLILQRS